MWRLSEAISYFIRVLNFLIIARALFSWFSRDYSNPIYNFLYQITEPILAPFRMLQEKIGFRGMIDFSPILAIITLDILGNLIRGLL
ncbi:MAG: YggT family protein [Maledivibacter sp.]|jgi:YggT family protein|nr:YggT family protein [Maledivibacter sp.]